MFVGFGCLGLSWASLGNQCLNLFRLAFLLAACMKDTKRLEFCANTAAGVTIAFPEAIQLSEGVSINHRRTVYNPCQTLGPASNGHFFVGVEGWEHYGTVAVFTVRAGHCS